MNWGGVQGFNPPTPSPAIPTLCSSRPFVLRGSLSHVTHVLWSDAGNLCLRVQNIHCIFIMAEA